MLPQSENIDDLVSDFDEEELEKTETFAINISENIISGKVDELDALRQAIYLRLSIESDQHIIYPYTYGLQTLDLIGKPVYYVAAIIPDRIKETLLDDDRITDVTDFEFDVNKDKLTVKFVVHTIYGETIDEETVVSY
jgi:hypothetical protein